MSTLAQAYLKGSTIPTTLDWSLFSTPAELATALEELSTGPSNTRVIGLATHVTKDGILEFIALAVDNKVFVMYTPPGKKLKERASRIDCLERIFGGRMGRIVGFGIVRLAMSIKQAMGYDVRGFDLPPGSTKSPGLSAYKLFGHPSNAFTIDNLWDYQPAELEADNRRVKYLCFRAWISLRLATHPTWMKKLEINSCVAAETSRLSAMHFKIIFQMLNEVHRMDAAKSRTVDNDFSAVQHTKDGQVVIHNERFKTRVRQSETTKVVLVDKDGKEYSGKAQGVRGKQTFVKSSRSNSSKSIQHVRVLGREELTNAETARNGFLLHLLQGKRTLLSPEYPFIRHLWLAGKSMPSYAQITHATIRKGQNGRPLNQSQANVVEAMLERASPFVIAHGPPGTGKTTTISVAAREICDLRETVWIVAQSNVGVKNIAESLCKHGVDFKLLVSKEFHFEWHEHIYEDVNDHLIRTDEIPDDPRHVDLLFSRTRVVLCTLSTLSNPTLTGKRIFELVPVENLVVDEASQIGVFDYLSVFGKFKELQKVSLFGDPKQLPPYGQDAAPSLQSIFDIPHLKSSSYFLDMQCLYLRA
ncbi:hypothetical protein DFH11DRAFT_1591562 [Phellopilus nigrolimitatus]|nr:hypothetical protein DFH11DRAFT_1591562 [Phellopilus nigrolimitatus]